MAMARLYTFGCSFTNYKWNTWADILGSKYQVFENWGKIGAGNQFILNSLTECVQRNRLDSNDTVMIMWSTPCRDDRYVDGHWVTKGNVFNSDLPKEWQEKYCDDFGFLLRDFSFIACAKTLLENLGIKYYMFKLADFYLETSNFSWKFERFIANKHKKKQQLNTDKLFEIYQPVLDVLLPDVFSVVYNNDWNSCKDRFDDPLVPMETILEPWWDLWIGDDWPSLHDYVHNKQNLDKNILQEIDPLVQDLIQIDVTLQPHDEKYVRCYDNHPTTEMHLEYLQAVLPDHNLPSEFPREKTSHGYEFERF